MKVFDILNERWYEKKDLIKECYKAFMQTQDTSLSKQQQRENTKRLTKEYIRENTLTTKAQVRDFLGRN